jgi:hypothetical protein
VAVAVACAVFPGGAGAAQTIGMTMFPTLDTDPDPAVNPMNDAEPFAACTSPHTVKAKLGTHVFTVVASDAAGNADPTAAAKQFKVVPAG